MVEEDSNDNYTSYPLVTAWSHAGVSSSLVRGRNHVSSEILLAIPEEEGARQKDPESSQKVSKTATLQLLGIVGPLRHCNLKKDHLQTFLPDQSCHANMTHLGKTHHHSLFIDPWRNKNFL